MYIKVDIFVIVFVEMLDSPGQLEGNIIAIRVCGMGAWVKVCFLP